MELLRITRQIHCKAVEQTATLIHRQYNRDWGISYSRPPIDPYLTSPSCYKILAATPPLPLTFVHNTKIEPNWSSEHVIPRERSPGTENPGFAAADRDADARDQ